MIWISFAIAATTVLCEEESSSVCLEDCPAGWEPELKQNGSLGEHCYKLYTDKKTWQEAQTECEKSGAHLLHLEDYETNAFYGPVLDGNDCWIGYQKENVDTWVNTDAQPISYNPWFSGEPTNGPDEDCAVIRYEYNSYEYLPNKEGMLAGWAAAECVKELPYICQSAATTAFTLPPYGLDEKIWHGETDIADWNAFGGNRPDVSNGKVLMARDYESMFDNDLSTFWHGYLPVTEQNKVVVTFKKPVEFHELQIVTRPTDKQYFAGSYQSMCLVLDDDINEKNCTPANNDVDIGQVLVLSSSNTLTATKVELIIQNGEVGKIADFKIHYQVFRSGDCYEDSEERIFPYFADHNTDDNQISYCNAACQGYAYLGVEGSDCHCGNILPDITLHRPGECNAVCSGNAEEICGDEWRMNIYPVQTTKTTSCTTTLSTTTLSAATIGFNCFQLTVIFVLGLIFRQ